MEWRSPSFGHRKTPVPLRGPPPLTRGQVKTEACSAVPPCQRGQVKTEACCAVPPCQRGPTCPHLGFGQAGGFARLPTASPTPFPDTARKPAPTGLLQGMATAAALPQKSGNTIASNAMRWPLNQRSLATRIRFRLLPDTAPRCIRLTHVKGISAVIVSLVP